ncbi:hypothetical protein PPYR_14446 [Photinus pyralis]|uniref:N-acetyltransferase 9-like protein n=3 Tax=Photinus pyralis TaxID=7054 RepID=A0A1Y1MA28_PHOPY|nr:N-acetyltransferase 9-like protein [Photinus pyralis]KAB0792487.1 hypothetical protein PPYR_14446 [Photinus pyralis]
MLINQNTKIVSKNVVLVPYRKEHVEKYNNWMQSEELQRLTASEPLTLAEEYEMQQSWMRDENKCTFIILDRDTYDKTQNEIEAMVGDTNLFFANDLDHVVAEAEIMIAETQARGKHIGWRAMLLMLMYGVTSLHVRQYVVKITRDNQISINMFEKMGFVLTSTSEVFNEVTLNRIVDDSWITWLTATVGEYDVIEED